MKKLIILALAGLMLLTALTGCGTKPNTPASGSEPPAAPKNSLEQIMANGKIVLATSPDFAPYEFLDHTKTGQEAIVGADIELAKYIAAELGVKLEIKAMDFSAVIGAVQQGSADMAISGLAYKPERAEAMDLSEGYNRGGYQGILVRAAEADKYTKAEDFAGKVVAVQNGSLQHTLLTEQIPAAVPQLISSINDGIMMLIEGKVDALGMSGAPGDQYAKNYDAIVMSEYHYDYVSEGTRVGLMKNSPELLAKINEIIATVEDEGLYQQWVGEAQQLADSLAID